VTVDPHPDYRADIDGLRGVAILSVVGFHAFPHLVRGGFVGVDVFFVISGYLISSIIVGSLRHGRFSLRAFYARRIRRLFPALIVVLVACFATGWFTLLAGEFKHLGKHIAGGSAFSANLILWSESGYFDPAAELKPLLHLWSLGVEERFYIIWPLLLFLAWKRRFSLLILTLTVVAVSFSISINAIGATPVAANLKASAGVLLIAAAVFGLSRTWAFPGWWALLPTIGAFLVISAGPDAWPNRHVLSHRFVVLLGLISYPLYLWHWPLLSFAHIYGSAEPSGGMRAAAALLSVLLAWLTYTFVERPVRNSVSGKQVGILVVLMLAIGSLGAYTFERGGFESRFPESLRRYANYQYDPGVGARPHRCWLAADQPFTDYAAECVDGISQDAAARPLMLVWGDSHAARLYAGLNQVYSDRYRLAQFTRDSCLPVVGLSPGPCMQGNSYVLRTIQETRPSVVILFAVWDIYSSDWTRESVVAKALVQTISELKRIRVPTVVVVGPAPKWRERLPKLVYEAVVRDPRHRVPLRLNLGLDPSFVTVDSSLKKLLAGQPITYVSLRDIFCNGDGCLTQVGNSSDDIVSWDYGHFTIPGAVYAAKRSLP